MLWARDPQMQSKSVNCQGTNSTNIETCVFVIRKWLKSSMRSKTNQNTYVDHVASSTNTQKDRHTHTHTPTRPAGRQGIQAPMFSIDVADVNGRCALDMERPRKIHVLLQQKHPSLLAMTHIRLHGQSGHESTEYAECGPM